MQGAGTRGVDDLPPTAPLDDEQERGSRLLFLDEGSGLDASLYGPPAASYTRSANDAEHGFCASSGLVGRFTAGPRRSHP